MFSSQLIVISSLVAILILAVASDASASPAQLKAVELRCEYHTDPLAIDAARPRLSWILVSEKPDARGQAQSAYQIIVASSMAKLDAQEGDLWDSGRVKSDETAQIAYGGEALSSGKEVFWKVRIWNAAGERSDWSRTAKWSMGLLESDNWKAKWIGYDAPEQNDKATTKQSVATNLENAKWIWFPEGDPKKEAPNADRYFVKRITLPEGKPITAATYIGSADNHFQLLINGQKSISGGDFHRSYTADVAKLLKPGENLLAIEAKNSGGPGGVVGRLIVMHGDAPATVLDLDSSWKSAKEKPAGWDKGEVDESKWQPAKEIATAGDEPWGMPSKTEITLPPPPYLRKSFASDKPVRRAMLYASALGVYELHLNGRRVGNEVLAPGWTNYNKRVHYQAYDVTKLIESGPNALAGILGDGWYAGYFSYQGKRHLYGENPRLLVQLQIEYDDGSTQTIVSDDSWRAAYGPIREADLLMGSAYDARREMPRWDQAGFDDTRWQPVVTGEAPKAKLEPHSGVPVRTFEEIPAESVTEPTPGAYVFDLGQNMVGCTRLKVTAPAGRKITLRHAEMLNPDGTIYTTSLRGARATDSYTTKGGGPETWEPSFTFHGFRYVEVSGLPAKPSLDTITGIVAHSDIARSGEFECSNPLVNQLFHNIVWGQKGNYLEVPTDCPQRDERLGWTGDAQFFIPTGAYNFDVASFFTKWLVDLDQDAQHEDGTFADVAPDLLGGHGNVAWGDAGIICPYAIYRYYGDTRVIEQHYAAMAKYIDYLEKSAKNYVRGVGAYGDWLNLDDKTNKEVIGTAYFYHVTQLMAEMANMVGKVDDAKRFGVLAGNVRDAWIKNFLADDGGIKESGQTGYALAFTMGLIPGERRAQASEQFAKAIERKNNHLATGFIGTPRLLPGLSGAGRTDLAYRLFLNDTYPSWLYPVTLGATTMWERWDGWHPDKGFQDAGMNSFNHYAFGSVGEWMYRTVGGIDSDGPGFKKIKIAPQPGGELKFAKTRYRSIRGEIATDWRLERKKLLLDVEIPPNSTATVCIPAKSADDVTEGDTPAGKADGVEFVEMKDGAAVYRVGSGSYHFQSNSPR